MLLFAVTGITKADIVEIGTGGTTNNQYLPGYNYYNYSYTQQIYTAEEIGTPGTINSIAFKNLGAAKTRTYKIYMAHTEKATFTAGTDWVAMSENELVFQGQLTFPVGEWTTITLDTPFNYDGASNLIVSVADITGSYTPSPHMSCLVFNAANQANRAYRDSGAYNVAAPGVSGTVLSVKNQIQLDINASAGGITIDPEELNMGYRPIDAWMPPYTFEMNNDGAAVTVTMVESNNPYFSVVTEVPFTVNYGTPFEVEVATGTANAGEQTGQLMFAYPEGKGFSTFDITAIAYTPDPNDVVETATSVTTFPYTANVNTNSEKIQHNYNIPGETEAMKDVVYKVTFANEVAFTATAADGVAAIYTPDFYGEPGPMVDNVFNGQTSGGGNTPAPGGNGDTFTVGFEDGMPTGWNVINANNDQVTWTLTSNITSTWTYYTTTPEWYRTGTNAICCGSFVNGIGAVNPDDYLVTPQVTLVNGSTFSFWAAAADEGYPEEHFGVFVSDNGTSDWTMVQEWTLTAKRSGISGGRNSREGKGAKVATWHNYSVDLSAYAGQKYIAIRHFDCYDQYIMIVDDIELTTSRVDNPVAATTIDNMYLPAGSYYVVLASATSNFEVNMEVGDVPAPEPAIVTNPEDGTVNVPSSVTLEWELGAFTSEMQVLFGTQYPPTDVLIDWTSNLVTSYNVTGLEHNKKYFIQVNARNAAGTTPSIVYGFTTVIDPATGLAVANDKLYPGESAELSWNASSRSLKGYNLYMDGDKINDAPITETQYVVDSLEYNMTGYSFQVSAQYDEGESQLSSAVVVKMTGNGTVNGTVYEQDETTPVADATVTLRGTDEYGVNKTFTFTTDENGAYEGELLAGTYKAYASKEGYQESARSGNVEITYDNETPDVDIIIYEYYAPLGQIRATEQTEENNVLVEWDWTPGEMIVDFETGDFSQAEFTLPATYPWAITNTNAHEGTYCMKSTCEGIASGTSEIEVTVEVPFDAKMGFWVKTSTEATYDKFFFYIDGIQQGTALTGNNPYAYKEYALTAGTHTYKWSYQKDSSVNSGDDCVYVDDITMYRQDIPAPPVVGATDYNFDDGSLMGWTNIDADGDGNVWVSSSTPGIYHNAGVNLSGTGHNSSEAYVISGSYANQTQTALTPDNYLVSPQISAEDGALIRFYACAQDASYAAEVFGVAVSTAGNTSAADFTTIETWTMTAKCPQGATAEREHDIRGNRQGSWYEYTVDLSDYAGQDIYVAIRHYNCTDMFILNVDDITLATGGSKNIARDERSFQHFNLYRRDIQNGEEEATIVSIAQPAADVYEYIDEEWADLPYGAYQWGIQAFYEGNGGRSRDEVVIGEGTTTNQYLPSYSYYNYSLTEQIYTADEIGVGAGTINSIAFFNGGTAKTRDYDIYLVNTTKEVFADNFDWIPATEGTLVFSGSKELVANEWTTYTFDTPFEYTGGNLAVIVDDNTGDWSSGMACRVFSTSGMSALRIYSDPTNYDPMSPSNYSGTTMDVKNQIVLDIEPAPVSGDGMSEILWSNTIEKDMYSTVTVNVTLNNGQSPEGVAVALGELNGTTDENGTVVLENVRKGEYDLAVTMAEFADYNETVTIEEDEEIFNVTLMEIVGAVADLYVSPTGWAMWSGAANGGSTPTPPTPGGGQWYHYGDASVATSIGAGAAFSWAVMFPAGSYTGNMVTKVAAFGAHDDMYATNGAFNGTVTLYNDGTSAPANAVGTMNISMPDTDELVEFEFPTPVTIDPTKNLWVVFYNSNSEDYIATACSTSEPNANWVSLDGTTWSHLNEEAPSLAGYGWTIQAYVASGSKENVVSIADPMKPIANPGKLAMSPRGTRAALSFKVMLDGTYEGETRNGYFQHNVEGFEEGSVHTTSVAAIYATGMGEWTDYTWTYTSCENFAGATNVTAEQSENVVNIAWTMPDAPGPGPGPTPPPTGDVIVKLTVGDVWGDGSGYQMLLDDTHSLYGTTIPTTGALSTSCSGNDAIYAQFSHKIPENADGNCSTNNIVINNSVEITIPAGTYDWCITNPTPGDRIWIAASNGNVGGRQDDYVFEGGNIYEFTVSMYGGNDGVDVTITGGAKNVQRSMGQDNSDCRVAENVVATRDMWDLVTSFNAAEAAQYGVACDGNYIYTCNWGYASATHNFFKYDLQGNMIEGFDIPGCGTIRDLTYDGEYFYGGANSSVLYCVDMNTKTLVSSTTTSCSQIRHCSYDPDNDGFWVGGWSDLKLIDRTGATIQNGPVVSSVSGTGYYTAEDGSHHLYLFTQANSDAKVYDFDIATNTVGAMLFDFASTPGFDAANGSSGGAFIGTYNGKTCFFGDVQQSPNLIGIYELDGNGTPTPPPTPSGDILGAYVFRNGELISGVTPLTTTTFVDTNAPAGDNEYCVRVVYGGEADMTYYAMSCPACAETEYECIPVNNLVAEYTYNAADDYGVTLTWECEHADDVLYYNIYYSDTIVSGVTELEYYVEMTGNPGEYTYSVTAVYPNCESEPVYADVNVTSVNDINNKVVIYPNPTNSTVTIEAANMKHITVVNALGQVVYDTDLTADMTQLNLGQYKPGVYMVRINTEEGVSVKRVTVVK